VIALGSVVTGFAGLLGLVAWKTLGRARFASALGGAVALALVSGPLFRSLHDHDGRSQLWWLAATVVVGATQVPGFLAGKVRGPGAAVLDSVLTGLGLVTVFVVAAGAAVWTVAWERGDLGPAMGRSFVMTLIITTAQVTTSIMAAYAFVFLRFPFKRLLFAAFMATLLLPLEVTLVGNVALIRQLEWTDTTQALVLPFAATALGTFLIRQGFRGLPSEIQDATRLDGYGHLSFLTKFAVPLTRPVIASFTVISALQAWNQYLWPRSVIEDPAFNTLQIQLRTIKGSSIGNANVSIAAALVAALPVVVLLIAFQRQIIRGLTAGAVK
jgi:sn-glycerol 3-phosphate transport system permease protein